MDIGTILPLAKRYKEWMVDIRRDLHKIPELQFDLQETSARVQAALDDLDVSYETGKAETGIVAKIGSGGPCVALRADMDALPITEETGLGFQSQFPGRMHACGHDCHTAMLLGAARILKERERTLGGRVRLLFQPAEEGGGGGKRMCDEGALGDAERIFGLHVWPDLPTGQMASCAGPFMAAASLFEIMVEGQGGHAAIPHQTRDPLVTAAKIICELQTIISRELDPLKPGVISITSMADGNEAYNVIPSKVTLLGTIRSLDPGGLAELRERVQEIAEGVARANRCQAVVSPEGIDYPVLENDRRCWETTQAVWRELVAESLSCEMPPTMGAEDFSFYARRIPACFVALGIRNEEVGSVHGLHSPKFRVDEDSLPFGAGLHVGFALRSLEELRAE